MTRQGGSLEIDASLFPNRPQMNDAGLRFRRDVLARLGISYRVNFENDAVTIEDAADFVRVAWEFARLSRTRLLPVSLDDTEIWFIAAQGGEGIRVRLTGKSVLALVRLAPLAFPIDTAGHHFFDSSVPIRLDAVRIVAD